jgi:hypothetical protein
MHRSLHFCHYLNASWKGVLHCLRFFLDHLIFIILAAFQFYLQSEKGRKVRGGGNNHAVFGKKLPGEKGRVR